MFDISKPLLQYLFFVILLKVLKNLFFYFVKEINIAITWQLGQPSPGLQAENLHAYVIELTRTPWLTALRDIRMAAQEGSRVWSKVELLRKFLLTEQFML